MKEIIFFQLLLHLLFILRGNCDSNEIPVSKKLIPYYRRQVEEIEEKTFPETTENDESHSNIVSFLVDNVKEIFDDIVSKETKHTVTSTELTESIEVTTKKKKALTRTRSTQLTNTSEVVVTETSFGAVYIASDSPTVVPDTTLYENSSITASLDDMSTITEDVTAKKAAVIRKKQKPPKDKSKEKYIADQKRREPQTLAQMPLDVAYSVNNSESDTEQDLRRSCIMCNNVATEDCNDPENKLIQSVMCERDEDMCYTMHTPFGIVDRGCFNTNHNLTTYVCSCNLCNYISISDMPHVFTNKQDWADNVLESSRTRRFRNSIFRDMSCLKCEVNMTQQIGDVRDSANCLEGTIGDVPQEDCASDEVCGVKALRSDGYVWRGCLKAPLFNYWWSFCSQDLCNYEPIISLYDFY